MLPVTQRVATDDSSGEFVPSSAAIAWFSGCGGSCCHRGSLGALSSVFVVVRVVGGMVGWWDGRHLAHPHCVHAGAIKPLDKCHAMVEGHQIGQHRGGLAEVSAEEPRRAKRSRAFDSSRSVSPPSVDKQISGDSSHVCAGLRW